MVLVDRLQALAGQDFVEVGAGHATRFGGREGMAAAAAVVGEDLGTGASRNPRRRGAGHTGVHADVGGDVVEVLAGDDLSGHRDGGVVVAGAAGTRPGP